MFKLLASVFNWILSSPIWFACYAAFSTTIALSSPIWFASYAAFSTTIALSSPGLAVTNPFKQIQLANYIIANQISFVEAARVYLSIRSFGLRSQSAAQSRTPSRIMSVLAG